jgi:hypothetical protein
LLHSFDYSKEIRQPVRDANGFPIVKDGRLQVERMTVADHMFRYKILERRILFESDDTLVVTERSW